ncbi:ROK family transcriptional regulator [Actinoallomurus sp. NPDC052308]|uniref:ROK family transcriptional regulator n=1 Tax=Actinoallomurus sp. NPDC052308 TaxID=3155530 RepID=UPI0034340D97
MPTPGSSATPGSQSSLREANQRRVIQAVREAGAPTQAEIARSTGLSRATVSNIVRELAAGGVLTTTPTSAGGRRARAVSLAPTAGLAVGVDFGHSHLRVAIGNLAREVVAEQAMPLDVGASAADGLGAAERLMDGLLATVGATRADVLGIGLGVPGPIDAASGTLGSSTILPGWAGIEAAEEARRRLGRPVHVDNDANLGALAEVTWGAARGHADAAYIKIASGVGAGIVIGGRVYHGPGGTAGEIGHITLNENGPMCRCGNRGCLETYAGGRYLADLLRPTHGDGLTTARIVELALAGDAPCRRAVGDAGRYTGAGVASLCNLLNPRLVVVGGDLARAGDLLIGPMVEAVRRSAVASAAALVSIVPGVLGDRSEVLGALALVMNAWEIV